MTFHPPSDCKSSFTVTLVPRTAAVTLLTTPLAALDTLIAATRPQVRLLLGLAAQMPFRRVLTKNDLESLPHWPALKVPWGSGHYSGLTRCKKLSNGSKAMWKTRNFAGGIAS